MRTISKEVKASILIFVILLITISFLVDAINKNFIKIKQLESEITEQEIQIVNLNQQKIWYQELIRLQEELEKNLNQQVEILEEDLTNTQLENDQLRNIRAKLTAYSPLDNVDGQQAQGNPNRTSTGRQVAKHIAAADPKKLPYGTKLEVPGYGEVEIQDTGGALRRDNKNIRIDLFHTSYKEAMKFGVQDMEVKILEWGD